MRTAAASGPDGDGAYATFSTGSGSDPLAVAAGDVNTNGRPDIVTADAGGAAGEASVLLNEGTYVPIVPTARTGSAVAVGATTATLLGTVDGAGQDVLLASQYGTGASGTTYPDQTAATDASAVGGAAAEGADVTGLTPATAYHYRIVAESPAGALLAAGEDRTFTTAAAPAPATTSAGGAASRRRRNPGSPRSRGGAGHRGPRRARGSGRCERPRCGHQAHDRRLSDAGRRLARRKGSGRRRSRRDHALDGIDLITSHLTDVSGEGAGKAQFRLTTVSPMRTPRCCSTPSSIGL